MKWRVRKPYCRERALHMWHKWFAWFPVRVPSEGRMSEMTMVWLQTIERRGKLFSSPMHNLWLWQYKGDIL